MSNTALKKPSGSAAEKIMQVASELFFSQGYRATGINEIISKSGVAKATFYAHFKSKETLCKTYLESLRVNELLNIKRAIAAARTPMGKYLAPARSLEPFLLETKFRGCPFINIASEIPNPDSPLRQEGIRVYQGIGEKISGVCHGLVESDANQFGYLDPEALSQKYLLVFSGAIALAELYHDIWPVKHAVKTMQKAVAS